MGKEEKINAVSKQSPAMVGDIFKFTAVGNKDVYNPGPLKTNDGVILAGRVESRDNVLDSEVLFFQENEDGVWEPLEDFPRLELEDPFFSEINGEIIFGGVQTEWDASKNKDKPELITYRTVFYRGKDIYNLNKFTQGPERMKDIRLVELASGKIGVFSRPQGREAGRGRIGFTTIDSLEDLTPETIAAAPLIKMDLPDNYWVGSNAVYLLEEGKIGVLGHIAYKDEHGHLHYRAMTFAYNPETGESTEMKIVAERDDFPKTEAKEPRLYDVVFPAGFIQTDENTFDLYTGLSDAYVGKLTIKDPFPA